MKNKLTCILFFGVLFVFSALCLILPKSDFSESERRVLAAFPEISTESILGGEFGEDFEAYATDAFPFRDLFRSIKAYASKNAFFLSDNNGLYLKDGHLSKIEYPLNSEMLSHASERFGFIYENYLKGKTDSVFLSVVPDKNYFLGSLKLDYDKLTTFMRDNMPYCEYIDIFQELSVDDYYTTDSHWRQEKVGDAAEKIAASLGVDISAEYHENTLEYPFYGVYVGQSALNVRPDEIKYLTNDILDACTVTSYDTGTPEPAKLYDPQKAQSRDPYEMFLSGNNALLTVENPSAESGRELVIFRDSFASSLAPYFIPAYSKITLVDIRYIRSDMLGGFVDFENCDVLFLYSTTLLNNSLAMK